MSFFQSKRFIIAMVAAIAAAAFGAFFREIIPPIITPIIELYFPSAQQSQQHTPTININVPTAFQVNYLYRDAGNGPLKPILPGSVLRSGDHYKVVFTPNQNGYIYLFQVDSTGQFFQLFPMREFKGVRVDNTNPVKAGHRYVLPAEDKAFKLDRVVGRERLLLVVTTRPHGELESLAQRLNEARQRQDIPTATELNKSLVTQLGNFRSRGLESVEMDQVVKISWNQGGEVFNTFGLMLENLCEDCVYGMEFEHR